MRTYKYFISKENKNCKKAVQLGILRPGALYRLIYKFGNSSNSMQFFDMINNQWLHSHAIYNVFKGYFKPITEDKARLLYDYAFKVK